MMLETRTNTKKTLITAVIGNKCKTKSGSSVCERLLNPYLTRKLRPICKVVVGRILFN